MYRVSVALACSLIVNYTSVISVKHNWQVSSLFADCQCSTDSVPRDCADIQALGKTSSGVYTVYINDPPQPTQVYCDMKTDGGGWLVRRLPCLSSTIVSNGVLP